MTIQEKIEKVKVMNEATGKSFKECMAIVSSTEKKYIPTDKFTPCETTSKAAKRRAKKWNERERMVNVKVDPIEDMATYNRARAYDNRPSSMRNN